MDWKNLIVTDSDVLFGKPVVKGTRLSVEFLLDLKAAGRSNEPILENYSQLAADDLHAVYAFSGAADLKLG